MEDNRRILIVDDNQAIHSDMRKILCPDQAKSSDLLDDEDFLFDEVSSAPEMVQFQLESALQGKDGLQLVQKRLSEGLPYSVAFVDIRMPPGWDGVETIKHLWAADPDLQTVICTAYSDYSWNDIRNQLGFSDNLLILKKPFDNIEVVQLAHALTKKWSLNRQVQMRVADLDRLVAQRTTQLQETNDILRRECMDRTKAEEAFRAIFEASPIGIGLFGSDLRCLQGNRAFALLHELQSSQLVGRSPVDFGWSNNDELSNNLLRLLRSDVQLDEQQINLAPKNSESRSGLLWARAVEIAQVRHVLCFLVDISDRLRMEDDLRNAQIQAEAAAAAKSQFLANMSHEIRTPLNGVLGLSSFLEDGTLPEQVREVGHFIKSSGEMLRRVLDDVLDFSKIESGNLDIEEIGFSLKEVLEWAIGLQRKAASDKNLRITLSVSDQGQDSLIGDPARLRQILTNILSNAVKFTTEGSIDVSVSLSLHESSKDRCWLRISVADTGIGIPADRMHRLFQSFSQVDTSTARRFGGTGLGLAISKRLAQLMGGDVTVESEEGVGTTFTIQVLLSLPNTAKAKESDAAGRAPTRHILVVEDNPVNCLVIQRMLSRLGHTIEIVNDGYTAIERVQTSDCDLVFMDINMPGLDGLEATRRIRALQTPRATLPIIALTASALSDDRQECVKAGMNDFLSKPISIDALKATLAKWSSGMIQAHDLQGIAS